MLNDYKEFPLVSIIVVTYNSSEYVIETLESAKRQTYRNIELIISDDDSKDETVEICANWIEKNKTFFKNAQLITTKKNTGIPENCNRGLNNSKGEWTKLIAGDDILVENCLELFMDTISKNKEIEILVGRFQTFTSENGVLTINKKQQPQDSKLRFFDLNPREQLKMLITESDFGFSPGVFIKKELFVKFGFFNKEFPFLEDLPFFVNLSENDVQFHLIDSTVTHYRKGHGSLLKSNTNYFNINYMRSVFDFNKKIGYKKIPKTNILYYQSELVEYFHYHFIMFFFKNRKTKLSYVVGKMILLLSVKRVVSRIQKLKE